MKTMREIKYYVCDLCGFESDENYKICPNCKNNKEAKNEKKNTR